MSSVFSHNPLLKNLLWFAETTSPYCYRWKSIKHQKISLLRLKENIRRVITEDRVGCHRRKGGPCFGEHQGGTCKTCPHKSQIIVIIKIMKLAATNCSEKPACPQGVWPWPDSNPVTGGGGRGRALVPGNQSGWRRGSATLHNRVPANTLDTETGRAVTSVHAVTPRAGKGTCADHGQDAQEHHSGHCCPSCLSPRLTLLCPLLW